jgi:hypothetical protein
VTREPADLALCLTADGSRTAALLAVPLASPGVVDEQPGEVSRTGDDGRDGLPLAHHLLADVPSQRTACHLSPPWHLAIGESYIFDEGVSSEWCFLARFYPEGGMEWRLTCPPRPPPQTTITSSRWGVRPQRRRVQRLDLTRTRGW